MLEPPSEGTPPDSGSAAGEGVAVAARTVGVEVAAGVAVGVGSGASSQVFWTNVDSVTSLVVTKLAEMVSVPTPPSPV